MLNDHRTNRDCPKQSQNILLSGVLFCIQSYCGLCLSACKQHFSQNSLQGEDLQKLCFLDVQARMLMVQHTYPHDLDPVVRDPVRELSLVLLVALQCGAFSSGGRSFSEQCKKNKKQKWQKPLFLKNTYMWTRICRISRKFYA